MSWLEFSMVTSLPHPKGSKNKVTRSKTKGTVVNTDLDALIVEKDPEKENLTAEIVSLEENLTALKVTLKAKKTGFKSVNKEFASWKNRKRCSMLRRLRKLRKRKRRVYE